MASDMRGMGQAMRQAAEGLKLFEAQEDGPVRVDASAAAAYKAEVEASIAALEEDMAKLTGKDHKKERTARGKEILDLKAEARYVDACKVAKGLEPKFGHFLTSPRKPKPEPAVELPAPEPAPEEPTAKPKPKQAKPGDTAKELEAVRHRIMERKALLSEQGMTSSQQNKDEEVHSLVHRMQELKALLGPGSAGSAGAEAAVDTRKRRPRPEGKEAERLQAEISAYKDKLKTEFGYSNKEMKADPELAEMEAKLSLCKREA